MMYTHTHTHMQSIHLRHATQHAPNSSASVAASTSFLSSLFSLSLSAYVNKKSQSKATNFCRHDPRPEPTRPRLWGQAVGWGRVWNMAWLRFGIIEANAKVSMAQ